MTPKTKQLAAVAVVLVACTWWAATSPQSPIRPEPPQPDRPVLKFLGKVVRVAAKIGLAALWFAEPQPTDADEVRLVHAHVGIDGHQVLDNRRW